MFCYLPAGRSHPNLGTRELSQPSASQSPDGFRLETNFKLACCKMSYNDKPLTSNRLANMVRGEPLTVLGRKVDNYNNKLLYRKEKLWKNTYISSAVIY